MDKLHNPWDLEDDEVVFCTRGPNAERPATAFTAGDVREIKKLVDSIDPDIAAFKERNPKAYRLFHIITNFTDSIKKHMERNN